MSRVAAAGLRRFDPFALKGLSMLQPDEAVMPEDEEKQLTVSREDLYELVWSKPMRELAKDFGISDVALAKRCRRLAIPVPGRGYWARLDAGQKPYRPQLAKREPQRFDEGALTVGPADHSIATHAEGSA